MPNAQSNAQVHSQSCRVTGVSKSPFPTGSGGFSLLSPRMIFQKLNGIDKNHTICRSYGSRTNGRKDVSSLHSIITIKADEESWPNPLYCDTLVKLIRLLFISSTKHPFCFNSLNSDLSFKRCRLFIIGANCGKLSPVFVSIIASFPSSKILTVVSLLRAFESTVFAKDAPGKTANILE